MDQKIINLFDEYTHKPLSREVFLKKLIRLTGNTAAAMSVLPLLEVNYANAKTVSEQEWSHNIRAHHVSCCEYQHEGIFGQTTWGKSIWNRSGNP